MRTVAAEFALQQLAPAAPGVATSAGIAVNNLLLSNCMPHTLALIPCSVKTVKAGILRRG